MIYCVLNFLGFLGLCEPAYWELVGGRYVAVAVAVGVSDMLEVTEDTQQPTNDT